MSPSTAVGASQVCVVRVRPSRSAEQEEVSFLVAVLSRREGGPYTRLRARQEPAEGVHPLVHVMRLGSHKIQGAVVSGR